MGYAIDPSLYQTSQKLRPRLSHLIGLDQPRIRLAENLSQTVIAVTSLAPSSAVTAVRTCALRESVESRPICARDRIGRGGDTMSLQRCQAEWEEIDQEYRQLQVRSVWANRLARPGQITYTFDG